MTGTLTMLLAQAGPMGPMGPMGGGYGPMGGGPHGPMSGWGSMGMGTGWWGFLTFLAVVLLVVGAVALLTRQGTFGEDDAIAELRRAYARGDLTDEEYERRRARLS